MSEAIHILDLELPGPEVEMRRVSFDVALGDVLGIAGPPGVGKSTLLRQISGAVPARAAALSVLGIDGLREPRHVWEHVGYLRGDRENFAWDLSARQNLHHHGAMKRIPAAVLDREVNIQLQRVGLLPRADTAARLFERDDRLRLAMAQAWLDRPRLLLLDEPLHGASAAAAEEFFSSLEQWLAEDPDRTAIIAARSLQPFAQLLTHAVLLRERWLAAIPPHEVP
jgi:ABC-type multidrug transport system ATPase subunit